MKRREEKKRRSKKPERMSDREGSSEAEYIITPNDYVRFVFGEA